MVGIVAATLKFANRLSSSSAVALRLVELASDAAATATQLEAIAARDPATAVKLLRVANSSFFGSPRAVGSLSQAIQTLGLDAAIEQSLRFFLRPAPAPGVKPSFDPVVCARQAALTALGARTLARTLDQPAPDDFGVAALLQDVGVLAMEATLGDSYGQVFAKSATHEELLRREAVAFGFNHVDAGTRVLRDWQFPEWIVDAIRVSHETLTFSRERTTEIGLLPVCVAAAAKLAEAGLAGASVEGFAGMREQLDAWLDLGDDRYQRVMAAMREHALEIKAVFNGVPPDPTLQRSLEDRAEGILFTRNLRRTQSARAAATRLRELEHRTAVLEDQTQRDALTGLYNRPYLERVLDRAFERATAEQRPLSLVFIDLDRFKTINDTFGDAAGDQVLTVVARRLAAAARLTDTVARLGGEEFVVLLAATTAKDAQAVVERALSSVRDAPFRTREGADATVCFSAGVATHMEAGQTFKDPTELLAAADAALYTAKKAGGNRVVLYRAGDVSPLMPRP